MIPIEDAAQRIAELIREERATGGRFRKQSPSPSATLCISYHC